MNREKQETIGLRRSALAAALIAFAAIALAFALAVHPNIALAEGSSSGSSSAATEASQDKASSSAASSKASEGPSGNASSASSSAASKPSAETPAIDRATLQTDWSGEYDGNEGAVVVRRTIHILFEEVSESGDVVGTAIIGPSGRAANQYGVNGSYKIYGTLDLKTGKIKMQGRTWIDYPSYSETGKTVSNFQFIVLNGTLNQKAGTIEGATENGTWSMHAVDYGKFNVDSGFKIGVNSNNCTHSSESFLGKDYAYEDLTNAYYPGPEMYKALLGMTKSNGERAMMESYIHKEWGGSCFGIASTMACVYNGKFQAKDLTTGDAKDYYSLPTPVADEKFRNSITYYQVSQFLASYSEANEKCALAFRNSGLANLQHVSASYASSPYFLEMLVNAAASGKTYLFGYTYDTGKHKGGHSIVLTGCSYDSATSEYVVKAFDENTYKNGKDNGKFIDIRVTHDFSSFKFTDGNGNNIDPNSFLSLMLIDTDTLVDLPNATGGSGQPDASDSALTSNQIGDEAMQTTTFLTVPIGVNFKVTNAEGKTLTCSDGSFSGDMHVLSLSPIIADECSLLRIQTDDSEKFTFSEFGEGFTVDMFNKDHYLATDTEGIESVELSFKTGAVVKGKGKAKVTTSTPEGKTVSANFDVDGDAIIVMDGGNLVINYTQVINNIYVTNYIEGTRESHEINNIDNETRNVVVNVTELPEPDKEAPEPQQQEAAPSDAAVNPDAPSALDELIEPTRTYIDDHR